MNKVKDVIVDSEMSEEDALRQNPNSSAPQEIIDNLALLSVQYYSFDGLLHQGQIVVHKAIENDIKKVFEQIVIHRFPIFAVIPASHPQYQWSDDLLMEGNITSCFNYRTKVGKPGEVSLHGYGLALDINPKLNPYIGTSGEVQPKGATYDTCTPGTITEGDFLVELFDTLGFEWGGKWKTIQDYQHFEKKI